MGLSEFWIGLLLVAGPWVILTGMVMSPGRESLKVLSPHSPALVLAFSSMSRVICCPIYGSLTSRTHPAAISMAANKAAEAAANRVWWVCITAYCFGFISLVMMLSLAGPVLSFLWLENLKVRSASWEVSSRPVRTIAAWPSTVLLPASPLVVPV